MRYTEAFANLADCRRHLAGHECQRRRVGFGPWTIIETVSRDIIGLGGLYDDPFDPGWGPEIGYRFARSAWGRGYAGELVAAALALGHRRFGLAEIRAFTHPENVASRRVLLRAGFREERFVPAMNRLLYRHRRGATAGY
jgi:RimJ/RimL family protein N-acetyltransferase